MDRTEVNTTAEKNSTTIRKKSSFLRDSSYRIFHITKKTKEDSDDDDDNNIEQTINKKKKSCKKTNRNGLKQFLFPCQTSYDSPSIQLETLSSFHQSPPSAIDYETVSVKLLQKTKQDNIDDWSKTNTLDETTKHKNSLARADKFQTTKKNQVFTDNQLEIRASFPRRRKRFIVACGTVLMASSIIITIVVYVVIMTIRHKIQMNELSMQNRHG